MSSDASLRDTPVLVSPPATTVCSNDLWSYGRSGIVVDRPTALYALVTGVDPSRQRDGLCDQHNHVSIKLFILQPALTDHDSMRPVARLGHETTEPDYRNRVRTTSHSCAPTRLKASLTVILPAGG